MTLDVASQLASRVPALALDWSKHASDLDLPYIAMGNLAARLVAVTEGHDAVDSRALFDDIETRLVSGTAAERNLLIVGFLESLQNLDRDRSARWSPLLGPSTTAAWRGLNDFWQGRLEPADFNRLVDGPT